MKVKGSGGRITERTNLLTKWIDISSISEMLRSLRCVDSQIFRGYQFYESVFDERIISNIFLLSTQISEVISGKTPGKVIFSGCGTSGRIGWVSARSFNFFLKKHRKLEEKKLFEYIMAGTDKALLTSQEEPEDFPHMGEEDLIATISNCKEEKLEKIVFVGITCGLSALYVGGQLEYFLKEEKEFQFISSVIGFNPTYLARDSFVSYWKKESFLKLVQEIEALKSKDFFFLNPVVGPEAIKGSSRMKGGSATKILLDVLFATSISILENETQIKESIKSFLRTYETTCNQTYEQLLQENGKIITNLISTTSKSLRSPRNQVYYAGLDIAGIWGLIDSSEMVDTYGLKFDDIRAFVGGGWKSLSSNEEGSKMRSLGYEYCMDLVDFEKIKKKDGDSVILLAFEKQEEEKLLELIRMCEELKEKSECSIFCIWVGGGLKKEFIKKFQEILGDHQFLLIEIPKIELIPGLEVLDEFAMKLVLNNITTLMNVLAGVTYENIMINFKLANTKLVQRAIEIVANILNVEEKIARKNVLKAIWENEENDEIIAQKNENETVRVATDKDSIIPIAILLTSGKCENVEDAKKMLEKEPIIRNIIQMIVDE